MQEQHYAEHCNIYMSVEFESPLQGGEETRSKAFALLHSRPIKRNNTSTAQVRKWGRDGYKICHSHSEPRLLWLSKL